MVQVGGNHPVRHSGFSSNHSLRLRQSLHGDRPTSAGEVQAWEGEGMPKLWFLTVDWCNQGKRGIFCSKTGKAFSRVVQPLGEDEAHTILGPFALILAPRWELLTPAQVAQHNQWRPLGEFRGEYGYACQE